MTQRPTDKRYKTRRWQRVRLAVLVRDLWQCRVVNGCPDTGNVADHIDPVYEGMPDSEFFDPTNLRAACQWHNRTRGAMARMQREMGAGEPARPRRFAYGGPRKVTVF